MRIIIFCFLVFCLSGGLYAGGIMEHKQDSIATAPQRVLLNKSAPMDEERLNRFRMLSQEGFQNDCICRDYNLVETDSLHSRQEINQFLDDLLYQYGVVPDIVESPFVADPQYLVQAFEERPIYKAQVLFKGEPLDGVSWREFPHLKSYGVFRTSDATLSPQRRGYMFSPDIYNFTDRNSRISGPKLFRAIKYELHERLRYDFPLKQNGRNQANQVDHITATDLEFVKDPERGEVAYFNGNSSYIDIRSDFGEQLEEISISAWIKPDAVGGSLSLVGKGEVFSAKIFNGQLQFTTIGIRDHNTTEAIIEVGVWSHIAMVYVPQQKLYFYLNGDLVEEVPAADIKQADHALLIGSNLWGQNFCGHLSDLKIWKRALSDEEVTVVYQTPSDVSQGFVSVGWVGLLALGSLSGLGFLLLRRKKQSAKTTEPTPVEAKAPARAVIQESPANQIGFLNGFKVLNKLGEDITHKFSPKRRELLVLVVLYTLREEGISSKELSDILWPGFSTSNKKNNRSTQVKEIRKILENEVDGWIVFDEKKWRFETGKGLQVDLFEMEHLIPGLFSSSKLGPISASTAVESAKIISKGSLLPHLEEEWLDSIKADFNTRLLDLLTPYLSDDSPLATTDQQEIIDAVLVVDPLYDTAIKKKVAHLMSDGKYGSAKKVVENYKKLYHSYYNEHLDAAFLEPVET